MARCLLVLQAGSGGVAQCQWCHKSVPVGFLRASVMDARHHTYDCPGQPPGPNDPHVWLRNEVLSVVECLACGAYTPWSPGAVTALPNVQCVSAAAMTSGVQAIPTPPKVTGTTAGMFTIEGLDECQIDVDHRTYSGTCKRCRQVYSFEHLTRFGKPICPGELPKPGSQKTCAQCGGDWSAYLDAYYGTKHEDAVRCAKCRKG